MDLPKQKVFLYHYCQCQSGFKARESQNFLDPESRNFLDPGLANPKSWLKLWFKNTDQG